LVLPFCCWRMNLTKWTAIAASRSMSIFSPSPYPNDTLPRRYPTQTIPNPDDTLPRRYPTQTIPNPDDTQPKQYPTQAVLVFSIGSRNSHYQLMPSGQPNLPSSPESSSDISVMNRCFTIERDPTPESDCTHRYIHKESSMSMTSQVALQIRKGPNFRMGFFL